MTRRNRSKPLASADEVRDPHYRFVTSHGLVKFQSSDVRSFREVPEIKHLGDEATELKHCHQY